MKKHINPSRLFLPSVFLSALISLHTASTVQANDEDNIIGQKPQKSFTYVGGTMVREQIANSRGAFGLGVDALYLRKVWGGFSIGLNANYTFGLPSSEDLNFNPAGQTFTGKTTESSNTYTVSLVVGGISEFENSGRLAYFIGPMIGRRSSNYKTAWDIESVEYGVINSEHSSHLNIAGLTAGIYYKFPGVGWTVGLNANANLGSRHYNEVDFGSKVSLSLGYTF